MSRIFAATIIYSILSLVTHSQAVCNSQPSLSCGESVTGTTLTDDETTTICFAPEDGFNEVIFSTCGNLTQFDTAISISGSGYDAGQNTLCGSGPGSELTVSMSKDYSAVAGDFVWRTSTVTITSDSDLVILN